MKTCKYCKRKFTPYYAKKNQVTCSSSSCRDKQKKEYYLENKNKNKAYYETYSKEYYLKNKDKIKKKNKKWYLENKDRQRKYEIKNKDKIKEYKKEWYLKNKERSDQRKKENRKIHHTFKLLTGEVNQK